MGSKKSPRQGLAVMLVHFTAQVETNRCPFAPFAQFAKIVEWQSP